MVRSLLQDVQAKIHSGMKQRRMNTYICCLTFLVNKNTGFSPNMRDQHLYPVLFASEIVSETASLFSAQVSVQVSSKDKLESNQTNLSIELFKVFAP